MKNTQARRHGWIAGVAAGAALLAVTIGIAPGSTAHTHGPTTGTTTHASAGHQVAMKTFVPANARQAAVQAAMRQLWTQHMEWTYATVAAFVDGSAGLNDTMARLLRNQVDIGNAIKPFYGAKAGARLTALLTEHINDAVPVLVAAKAGDTAALNAAVTEWYRNAEEIGAFLSSANPAWKPAAMKSMMRGHITQTIAYASDMLAGDRAKAIADYGTAEAHMVQMADMLTEGLVAQFPKRF